MKRYSKHTFPSSSVLTHYNIQLMMCSEERQNNNEHTESGVTKPFWI